MIPLMTYDGIPFKPSVGPHACRLCSGSWWVNCGSENPCPRCVPRDMFRAWLYATGRLADCTLPQNRQPR